MQLQVTRPVTLSKRDSITDIFLQILGEIYKNTYFEEHLQTAALLESVL